MRLKIPGAQWGSKQWPKLPGDVLLPAALRKRLGSWAKQLVVVSDGPIAPARLRAAARAVNRPSDWAPFVLVGSPEKAGR
jgi:hypothetical protein